MIILITTISLLFVFFTKNLKNLVCWWNERKRRIELGEKIPGPKTIPIFGNMFLFMKAPHEMKKKFDEENSIGFKNNDPLRRYWIGNKLLVYLLKSDAAKVIFDSNIEISKGSMYEFFSDLLGEGLITSDGEKWKERRKLITPTFHFNMLKTYLNIFNNESKIMVKNIENFASNKEEVDVINYSKKLTLDIICEAAMGVKLNAQNDSKNFYLEASHNLTELFLNFFVNSFNRFSLFYNLFGDGIEKNRNIKIMNKFTNNVIKQKSIEFMKNNNLPKDNTFLSNLLILKNEKNLSDEDIREEVNTFMFAGHDTTATLISFLWWALACHQDIQENVYQEIYSIFGKEERDVEPEDLPKLDYLDMVIKETLRMYIIIPLYGRLLKNEIKVCDYIIPKGTDIIFCSMHTNFNPKIFPNPHKFDPCRFLPENSTKRSPYDFTPFSAGPRNCIGQKFALNEVKTVMIWLLRSFKLTTKKNENFINHSSIIFQKNKTIPVIFEKRI
ncbi:Cytochrome P450 4V2 [Strongyloides ratti]|uniref:Cytochrome P450 4V2 n=1 Tax=Strongyloides ratti TaxID=34506 RepID=A0A090LJ90_STRRB|nr:Cytochrome P450 4V2 [Strongyloides ratti]CEF69902.1 Cytochrome P450 4V2 [Strongyloides ratti]